MRRLWTLLLAFGLWTLPLIAQDPPAGKPRDAKTSYAVGVDLAKNLQRQEIEFDVDALLHGMRDILTKSKLQMTEEELQAALNAFQTDVKMHRARPLRYVSNLNKAAGDAYLADNAKKEGVVSLPSGLQYKVLKEGNGKRPAETDTVECNYRGTLVNGTEFDSSYRRGTATALKVAAVVPGLKEALQRMPVGSKWQVVVPPQLGYGEKGLLPKIEPYETLVFEIELLSVQ